MDSTPRQDDLRRPGGVAAVPPGVSVAPLPGPGRAVQILTVLWAIAAVLMAAFGHTFLLGAPLVLCGLLLGVAWCDLAFRRLILQKGFATLDRRGFVAWAFCPWTGLLLSAVCFTQWGLVLRVKLSEPALLRLVEEVEAGKAHFDPPVRAGLFKIDGGRVEGGCVLLETNEGWPLASEGIVYVREGTTQARFSDHLVGRWWAFHFPD